MAPSLLFPKLPKSLLKKKEGGGPQQQHVMMVVLTVVVMLVVVVVRLVLLPTYYTGDILMTAPTTTTTTTTTENILRVQKTHISEYCRFVFIAALGGTGHHGWRTVLQQGKICTYHEEIAQAYLGLWYGEDGKADEYATQLQRAIQQAQVTAHQKYTDSKEVTVHCLNVVGGGSMVSYPDNNHARHYPNMVSLAKLMESVDADLRIVVLHRSPPAQLRSLSIHRDYMPLPQEAQQMATQGAILNSQLSLLDPAFFICTGFLDVPQNAMALQSFVLGGMFVQANSLVEAIEKHYKIPDNRDNVQEALKDIHNQPDGTQIQIKIDEMEMHYQYLKQQLCQRQR